VTNLFKAADCLTGVILKHRQEEMTIQEATSYISEILNEERANPTTGYKPAADAYAKTRTPVLNPFGISEERKINPRIVHEDPERYVFSSVNYDLISAVLSHFDDSARHDLILSILIRVTSTSSFGKAQHVRFYPQWMGFASELPLIVELCIRMGETEILFRFIAESRANPGTLLFLMQIEDLIALNWNHLTRENLERLPFMLDGVRVAGQLLGHRSANVSPQDATTGNAIARFCSSISEMCRKARYLHLKDILVEMSNLQVNQDKVSVVSHLQQLGFSATLVQSLNHAEELYHSSSPFDLKSSLSHLRSFLEALHLEAAKKIQTAATSVPAGWGPTVVFLRQQQVVSRAEEQCVTGLYTLISDEAVHPLIAAKEYARLARNMVIEYGLLFLTKLKTLKSSP
jgi:hypothetical protein